MNIVAFLSMKLELFWTFKGEFKRWSKSNFELPKQENIVLGRFDEDFIRGENTQWNHTGIIKTIIRLILTIILCLICIAPTVLLYAIFNVDDNDVNGFILITALPLILMIFGIFYLFKRFFRVIGLAQGK